MVRGVLVPVAIATDACARLCFKFTGDARSQPARRARPEIRGDGHRMRIAEGPERAELLHLEMLKGRERPRNSLEINVAREAHFVRFRPKASQMRDGKQAVNRFTGFREHSQGEPRI